MTNPLTDVLPPKARKYVYAALTLGSMALSVYQASEGDWAQFAVGMLTALGFGTAASNVKPAGYGSGV